MKGNSQRSILLTLAGLGLMVGIRMIAAERRRYDLRGRVAIVTGGSRGLGLVIARQLAQEGVRLVICSRTKHQLDAASRELSESGAQVLPILCDVTDRFQVETLVEATVSRYGKVDILINNAGTIQVGPVDTMTEADYRDAMDIHFWAPLYTTLAALPHFRSQQEGRIVNIASIGGKISVPHLLPYCASKFALVGLSEGLRTELQRENIYVTTILPSLMRTGSSRNVTVKGDHEKEYAWFKTAAALPIISEDPRNVARKIVSALKSNNTQPIVSNAERFATITKAIAPEVLQSVFTQINRILPKSGVEGVVPKKGHESESSLSANRIAAKANDDARMNNEG